MHTVGAIADTLELGVVRVKDESTRLGLPSFKILGASWGVYRALDERHGGFNEWESFEELVAQLKPHAPLALAAATDGNHGRAVARMARFLGLDARIFVPQDTTPARIEAIKSEGALCIVVPGTYDDAVARSTEEASEDCLVISDTSWEGYEDVPRWIMEGYSSIFWEVQDQLDEANAEPPDAVIIQVGVGGLGAAAVRHFGGSGESSSTSLTSVEPNSAACVLASVVSGRIQTVSGPHDSIMAGLNCGTPSIVAWPYMSRGFDCYIAIDDQRAVAGMRMLAVEGIVSGETGAAGLGGLIELVRGAYSEQAAARLGLDRASSVLLISTEGATDPEAYHRLVAGADARLH